MKLITFEDIKNLNINPCICYEWICEALTEKDKAILPSKISLKPFEGAFINTMPCIIPDSEFGSVAGTKIVSRYPMRVPSLDSNLLLYNGITGEPLALMDANWITAMRTGCVAAHSIITLAKDNYTVISFIGLGNTARATLLVLLSLMPDKNFIVKLFKYKNQEESFCERFTGYKNIKFEFVESEAELVKGSDVVVSCVTYFDKDICSDDCFDEGILVVPVHTRGFSNCDLFFDKVFADDYGHVKHFKYFDKFKSFSEISSVINGKAPGRENNVERIIAYNIGIAVHDIKFASNIYKMLKDISKDIDIKSPEEKFWI